MFFLSHIFRLIFLVGIRISLPRWMIASNALRCVHLFFWQCTILSYTDVGTYNVDLGLIPMGFHKSTFTLCYQWSLCEILKYIYTHTLTWKYSHGHTWYLSFFLHGQNFWRIKFTPKKRVNYDKIHRKLPIFCVITAKYTVNCQFFALDL